MGVEQGAPGGRDAGRGEHQGAQHHRQGDPVEPGEVSAHARAGEDVAAPAGAGERRQQGTEGVHPLTAGDGRPRAAHEDNAHGRGGDGEQVPAGAGERGGHHERTGELDGDGHADGQAVQRGVEEEVHRRHGHGEGDHGPPVRGRAATQRGTDRGHEQQPGEGEPQGGGADDADGGQQGGRERPTDLHAHHGREHHRHRAEVGPGAGRTGEGHGGSLGSAAGMVARVGRLSVVVPRLAAVTGGAGRAPHRPLRCAAPPDPVSTE